MIRNSESRNAGCCLAFGEGLLEEAGDFLAFRPVDELEEVLVFRPFDELEEPLGFRLLNKLEELLAFLGETEEFLAFRFCFDGFCGVFLAGDLPNCEAVLEVTTFFGLM